MPGAEVVTDIDDIIEDAQTRGYLCVWWCRSLSSLKDYVELLLLPKKSITFEGDTYFPTDFPWGDFIKVKSLEGEVDEKMSIHIRLKSTREKRKLYDNMA